MKTDKNRLYVGLLLAGVLIISLAAIQLATGSVKYDLDSNDTIINLSSPSFRYSVIVETMTAPATPAVSKGYVYLGTDKLLYFKNSDGLAYDLTATGSAGASTLQLKEDGVEIASPTASIDFIGLFNLTESPVNEVNIWIDTTTLKGYVADNLGNAIATGTLNMSNYSIASASSIGFADNISISSKTYGMYLSTNVYSIGYGSFSYLYGNGSNLTGIVSGASVGGSTKQIQYNNGGVLAGTSTFTIETASNSVYISTAIVLGGDCVMSRDSAKIISLKDCYPSVTRLLSTDYILGGWSQDAGLSYQAFKILANGKMEWGDQVNARDANLYRSAAAILKTDGSLAASSITVTGFAASSSIVLGNNISITTTVARVVVSSNVYAVGYGSFTALYGDGSNLTGITATASGDSLGNHTATQTLNMANYSILNSSSISLANNIAVSSKTYGIYISTNIYSVGYGSFSYLYGNGSNLTGITATASGDSLGNHTATQTLNMANYSILNASSVVMASNISLSSATYGLRISSNIYGVGYSSFTTYYGDGSNLKGIVASGGASTLQVKKDDVEVTSPTVSIDFNGYFSAIESPVHETNIYIATATLFANPTFTGKVTASSISVSGVVIATSVALGNGVSITSTTVGVTISSNVYSIGYGSFSYLYGNGQYLTGIAASSGSAAGSNTQVQYNNSNVLAGDSDFTFNGATVTATGLSLGRLLMTGDEDQILFTGHETDGYLGFQTELSATPGIFELRCYNSGEAVKRYAAFVSSRTCYGSTTTYVTKDGAGNISFTDTITGTKSLAQLSSAAGDNLGSHIATKTLDMDNFSIQDASSVIFANNISISSKTYGVYLSTNIYGIGYASFSYLYGNGSKIKNIPEKAYFTYANDGSWDSEKIPIAAVSNSTNVIISRVDVVVISTSAATLTFDIWECTWTAYNLSGTSITATSMVACSTGTTYTTFSNSDISAQSALMFKTGTSASAGGTVDFIMGTIYYTRNE